MRLVSFCQRWRTAATVDGRRLEGQSYTRGVVQLALPLVGVVMYGVRARTLARRGTPVPAWRIAAFAGSVVLFVVSLSPPLEDVSDELFVFHMTQHVLLGDLAPLLFVLGLTGPLLRPLLAIRVVAALRPLAHPLVALPLWTLNLYLWHIPSLYESAVTNDAVHALEHLSFFTAGALMWAAVLEVLPGPAWFGTTAKLGYVVRSACSRRCSPTSSSGRASRSTRSTTTAPTPTESRRCATRPWRGR